MRIRNFFRKYKIHLLILFISVLIWIHVKTEMIYDEVFQAKIVPINVNPEFVIANRYTHSVPIRFQSKGKSLIALHNTEIEILVDLNETSKKRVVERLNLNSVRISPPIVNVLPLEFVEKDTIHFSLDALRYDMVPVRSRIFIKPKAGYIQVGKLKIAPAKITVSGPGSKTSKITTIATDSVSIIDPDKDVNGVIPLVNPFPEDIVLSSQQVEYSVDIQELGSQIIEDIPVRIMNKPRDLKVTVIPSTLSVKVTGGVNVVSRLNRNDIVAYIDFRRYDSTKQNLLPAIIKNSEDITFSDVYPELFEIRIERN